MSNPTTPFGWQMPTATDLVTDLPADFEVFGQAVATSMADLLGGTSGQVLAKNSNTDMDFVWVTSDDANAIQNTIVDAKGDLIAASASDVPARLAVGSNGETLVADSSTSTGLRWQGDFSVGRNKIINGDFYFNQRAFTSTTTTGTFMFDRFSASSVGGTATYTAQTFTTGAAPVAGYEGKNFLDVATTGQSAASDFARLVQSIESVRTLANQTVTISFWAKAASGTPKVSVETQQVFGSGGSPSSPVNTYFGQATLSTAWTRYSVTTTQPSISGKTIGTGNDDRVQVNFYTSAGTTFNSRTGSLGIQTATISFWGIQVEAGSVATAFQTATGTIQGELAACQRYYYRQTPSTSYGWVGYGLANGTTGGAIGTTFPVQMRTTPSAVEFSTLSVSDASGAIAVTSLTLDTSVASANVGVCNFGVASGLTAYRPYYLRQNANSAGYLAYTAEL